MSADAQELIANAPSEKRRHGIATRFIQPATALHADVRDAHQPRGPARWYQRPATTSLPSHGRARRGWRYLPSAHRCSTMAATAGHPLFHRSRRDLPDTWRRPASTRADIVVPRLGASSRRRCITESSMLRVVFIWITISCRQGGTSFLVTCSPGAGAPRAGGAGSTRMIRRNMLCARVRLPLQSRWSLACDRILQRKLEALGPQLLSSRAA